MKKQKIILFACGSPLIVDLEEICYKNNYEIVAIINNIKNGESHAISQDKVIFIIDQCFTNEESPFICTLFSPHNRYLAVQEALKKGLTPIQLLSDKHNDLPLHFKNGKGCFINKNVTMGAKTQIGNYVTINRGASLGHHFTCEDFVSIGPGVISGGNVTIKKGAMIGTGAVILPTRTIGRNAIIGAGSVVTKDVNENTIVVGNPAKEIGQNTNIVP